MTKPDAIRQRRYRAHVKGDHSLCPLEKGCDIDVTRPPARLEARGLKTWADLGGSDEKMPPEQRLMVEEIARITDRLERLDRALMEDGEWLTVADGRGEDAQLVIVVDAGLREVRQQQLALKQLTSELRAMRSGDLGTGQGEVDPLDELAKRRADRRAGAGGG